jgi:hypothetical protein
LRYLRALRYQDLGVVAPEGTVSVHGAVGRKPGALGVFHRSRLSHSLMAAMWMAALKRTLDAESHRLDPSHFHQYHRTHANQSYRIRRTGVDFPGNVVAAR